MRFAARDTPLLVALALSLSVASPGPPLIAQSDPLASYTAALEVDLVTLDVVVTDKQGEPVGGLEEKDFRLLEDGKKVKLTRFAGTAEDASSPAPQIVVLVDNRHLDAESRNRALDALAASLERRMETDETPVMIATYDGALGVVQPFTSDAASVRAALEGLKDGPVASDDLFEARRSRASFLDTNVSQLRQGLSNRREGQAAFASMFNQLKGYGHEIEADAAQTLSALGSLVSTLGGVNGKKALFLLSEGLAVQPLGQLLADFQLRAGGKNAALQDTVDISAFDSQESTGIASTSRIEALGRATQDFDTFSLEDEFSELVGLASSTRVAVYPLLVPDERGAGARREEEVREFSDLREGPEMLARGTGGLALPRGAEIGTFVERALGAARTSYTLAFEPKGDTGAYHRLEVDVKGKGLEAHHRAGYVRRSFAQRFADRAVAALMIDHGENHHRLDLEIEEQSARDDGAYDVKVLMLFPIDRIGLVESDGVHWAKAMVVAVATGPDGGLSAPQMVEVPLQIPAADLDTARAQNFGGYLGMTLPAGTHRLALGLWDVVSSRVSFVVEEIEIGEGS